SEYHRRRVRSSFDVMGRGRTSDLAGASAARHGEPVSRPRLILWLLYTVGNDGDDRPLRILEGIKAADIWDVGQWHDRFGTEFLRLTGGGVYIVHGDVNTPLGRSASGMRRHRHHATDADLARFHNSVGHARHLFRGPPQ